MTQQAEDATAGEVSVDAPDAPDAPDATGRPRRRSRTMYAAALLLVLLLTATSLLWDGLASSEEETPGAPHGMLDAEQ